MSVSPVHPLLLPVLLASIISPAVVAASPEEVLIQWAGGIHSPAIPTEDDTWFVSVAPLSADVQAGSATLVTTGSGRYEAKVLSFDPTHRLCLVQTSTPVPGLEPTEFASTLMAGAGEKLNCWKPGSTCASTVAGKEYSIRGEPLSSPLLRVHVANAEEFCRPGTPLVCSNGKLFGVLTNPSAAPDGEAHAIPVSSIQKLLTEYERYERTGKVWVGLIFEDRAQTPQVVEVRPGSPAKEAGIEPGDVILRLAGYEVPDLDNLTQVMQLLIAGNEVEVALLRGLSEETVKLTPEFAATQTAAYP